jgi:hypothetical protein
VDATATKRKVTGRAAVGAARIGGGSGVIAAGAVDDIAALTLDERGMIRDCSRGAELLFRCRRSELVWRHVSVVLPQLAELELMPHGQPNPRLRFLCRIGRQIEAVTHDGERFASDLFFNVLDSTGQDRLRLIVRPAEMMTSDCEECTNEN